MFKVHLKRLLQAAQRKIGNPYLYMIISGVGLLGLILPRFAHVFGNILFFLMLAVALVSIIVGPLYTFGMIQFSTFQYWSKGEFKLAKAFCVVQALLLPTVSVITRLFRDYMTVAHENTLDYFVSLTGFNALLPIFLGLYYLSAGLIIRQKEKIYRSSRR